MSRQIAGWRFDDKERADLLHSFPVRYARAIADHITLRFGTDAGTPLPTAVTGEIIGEADDGKGVLALVVRMEGTTERGDGSHFHVTWSLGPRRAGKESNAVMRELGWKPVEPPIVLALSPTRWSG